MSGTPYTVTAERGSRGGWVFQCVEYPGAISEARRLEAAHDLMPEAISFVADVDPSEVIIDLQFRLDADIQSALLQAREDKAHADELAKAASETMRKVASALVHDGISVRDTGVILGVSHQRIAQLTKP